MPATIQSYYKTFASNAPDEKACEMEIRTKLEQKISFRTLPYVERVFKNPLCYQWQSLLIKKLPPSLFYKVYEYLDIYSRRKLYLTCQRIYQIIDREKNVNFIIPCLVCNVEYLKGRLKEFMIQVNYDNEIPVDAKYEGPGNALPNPFVENMLNGRLIKINHYMASLFAKVTDFQVLVNMVEFNNIGYKLVNISKELNLKCRTIKVQLIELGSQLMPLQAQHHLLKSAIEADHALTKKKIEWEEAKKVEQEAKKAEKKEQDRQQMINAILIFP